MVEFYRGPIAGRDKGAVCLSGHRRLTIFSLAACVAYTAAYYFDWPLFRYYLVSRRFSFGIQPDSAGAPILWYGWLVAAILAGVLAAAIMPRGAALRLPPDLLWIVPVTSVFAALLYEARWFL